MIGYKIEEHTGNSDPSSRLCLKCERLLIRPHNPEYGCDIPRLGLAFASDESLKHACLFVQEATKTGNEPMVFIWHTQNSEMYAIGIRLTIKQPSRFILAELMPGNPGPTPNFEHIYIAYKALVPSDVAKKLVDDFRDCDGLALIEILSSDEVTLKKEEAQVMADVFVTSMELEPPIIDVFK